MLNFLLSLPDLLLIILGFIFLVWGGESVVQGAITLARKMNVSPLLIGFTIIAVGTSLPELAVSLKAVSSCLLYTSPSPRDGLLSRMPSSA